MKKELLIDTIMFDIDPEQLQESIKENGKCIVKGIIQRANHKNYNERIYPKDILMREVKKYSTKIAERRALGELDHPDSSVVNLQNVSHNVLKVDWNGDDLHGVIEILGTPSGNILKELLNAGIKLGISSRGMGSVKEVQLEDDENGSGSAHQVEEDFELIAFDFVSDPSTQGAFMNKMNESKNYENRSKYAVVESLITDILTNIDNE